MKLISRLSCFVTVFIISFLCFFSSTLYSFSKDLKSKDKKISLDLRDVDIVDTLKFLAVRAGINIVIGKNITGRISLFLKDITIEDAIEILILSNGLSYVDDSTGINVMTDAEYSVFYGESFQKKKLVTKVFQLKYGAVEEIKMELLEIVTEKTGQVEYDVKLNKISITDLPVKIEKIEKLLKDFEEKNRKIVIEVKIFQLILDKKHQTGIDMASIGKDGYGDYDEIMSLLKKSGEPRVLSDFKIDSLNRMESNVLEFHITPVIEDEFIKIDIRPEAGPVKGTRIKDKTALILGGLLKDEKVKREFRIPVLSKIPLLGGIFRYSGEKIKKTERIILITPVIVDK